MFYKVSKTSPFDVSTVPYSGVATTTRPLDDPTKDGQVSCAKSWDWQSSRSPPRNSTLLHVHLVVLTFFSVGSLGRPVFGVVAAGPPGWPFLGLDGLGLVYEREVTPLKTNIIIGKSPIFTWEIHVHQMVDVPLPCKLFGVGLFVFGTGASQMGS